MENKIKAVPIVLFFSVVIFLLSCGKQKAEWKGTIEEVDGVIVVKNPKEPIYGEDIFTLEEELTLGGRESSGEPLIFSIRPLMSVQVDENENIYVLDDKECRILIFDKKGEYLRNFGKKGQGPGELQNPIYIGLTSQNEIMTYDTGNRRLTYFSHEGDIIKEKSTSELPRLLYISPDSDGNLIALSSSGGIEELVKCDPDLKTIFVIAKKERQFASRPINVCPLSIFFNVLHDDKIGWSDQTQYEYQIVSKEGEIIKRVITEYEPVKITQADIEKRIKLFFGDRPVPPGVEFTGPENFPPFNLITSSDDGRIILQTPVKVDEREYYYDVYDSDGKYIAKVPIRGRPIVWKRNKLYTADEDLEGYKVVKRYKVTWKY